VMSFRLLFLLVLQKSQFSIGPSLSSDNKKTFDSQISRFRDFLMRQHYERFIGNFLPNTSRISLYCTC
jgi:hypothetical protein